MYLAFSLGRRNVLAEGTMRQELQWGGQQRAAGLVDVLDRVLDKGLVIAGDIKISLAEVELLTIRIRLIVCSLDKAQEVGIDWWRYDEHLAPGRQPLKSENEALRKQIELLERKVAQLTAGKQTVDATEAPTESAGARLAEPPPRRARLLGKRAR
jgi:hypothetical protein